MSFNELVQTIESSDVFKDFQQKHPDATLCAGFFIIDMVGNDNKQAIDYKNDTSIFSFSVDDLGNITVQEDELIQVAGRPQLKPLEKKITIDHDQMIIIAKKALADNKIIPKLQKIIAVVQRHVGKESEDNEIQIWNLTCMLEGLGIINMLVDSDSAVILKFEKKSVMDFMKKN
ncbi:MAG: hypothetical protein RL557_916 [archaeon]|jgi:hypothetical protein